MEAVLVGGPGFEPGASRSRNLSAFYRPRREGDEDPPHDPETPPDSFDPAGICPRCGRYSNFIQIADPGDRHFCVVVHVVSLSYSDSPSADLPTTAPTHSRLTLSSARASDYRTVRFPELISSTRWAGGC